jgi:NADH:ubiquinone oxidoreductase subunit 5 (subunit L)/multisubunit Na+/H+ antiporter MnhA subunit
MLALVLSANYLGLFLGWEGVGLASYLLIGFWQRRPLRLPPRRPSSSSGATSDSRWASR